MTRQPLYTVLALAVLFLTVVPVGIAVFVLGFLYGDSPCVMCWEQRIGMALIALNGLFILRYGPKPRYVGLAVLTGAWGIFMGFRHSALHLARDIGQGFSLEILGAHTYTWSMLIFWVCVITMGLLLVWLRDDHDGQPPRRFGILETVTAVSFLIVIAANAVQAFASTGPPPFMGQGDPVRFSFHPANWVWSLEEWDTRTPITWRGRWAAEKPSLVDVPTDPGATPLVGTTPLRVVSRRTVSLPLDRPPTDLAYDTQTDRFVITTDRGVFVTDAAFSTALHHTVIDTGYSVDLARLAGTAFLDSRTILAVSENKSVIVLRLRPAGSPAPKVSHFRYFLTNPDVFDNVTRTRFTTVRARLMYTQSAAFDPASQSILTVTVPNARSKRLVVSRFDRDDLVLREEFTPTISSQAGLTLKDRRSLDEYVVTGATVVDGRLHAISAAFGTVLIIDPATAAVVAARTIGGIDRPVGIAVRHGQYHILTAGGALIVAE